MTNRWWVYQQERFPLLAHGPLVVIFCLSVLSFSSLQRGDGLPQLAQLLSAVVSTLILFFQLRVSSSFS